MRGAWGLWEKVWTVGFPYVAQSQQLPALVIRDDAIHHHPLGAIQHFGVHGQLDAFVEQRATCKAMTRLGSVQCHSVWRLSVRNRNPRGFLFTRETSHLVASTGSVAQGTEPDAEDRRSKP